LITKPAFLKFLKSPSDFSSLKSKFNRIYLKPTFTNIIITLTDANNKVLACHSSGSSGVAGTSRRKKAPQAVAAILRKLHPSFLAHNVRVIELIVRKMDPVMRSLIRELRYYGITIIALLIRREIAHNGVRHRKMPRK